MKLSALDIRKQEFTRVVRGYDKEEVDAFLQLAANQWQELVDDLRREEEKVTELNIKLEHYQKVEEALEEALKTARDGAKKTIENAEHKARLVLEEAESRSIGITREAETERLGIRKDAAKYSVRQKEIVAKLRAFLMSELEILAQYESEAPANYVKLMPAEVAELIEDSTILDSPEESYEEPLKSAAELDQDYYSDEEEEAEYDDDAATLEDELVAELAQENKDVVADFDREEEGARTAKGRDPSRGVKSPAATVKKKEPEVSDEIEKIRRILEDLEK